MGRFTDYDLEDEESVYRKPKTKRVTVSPRKPVKKASYESNADVQRWLKEHALEEKESAKPPFQPTFLASRRDSFWVLSSLAQFYEQDLITDVLHAVKSGKEASVYCCTAHPSLGVQYLAAKVYRPRMFRSLRNDAIYRQSRVQRDAQGQLIRGSHYQHGNNQKSERGRATQVLSWIEYEFQTQRLLYEAGATVPRPFAQIGNAVLMEYIGNVDDPAPLLYEATIPREEAQQLFEDVLNNIELSLAHGRIHGDLSEYNILLWQGRAVLIDFAQAVDPHHNPAVFSLLVRDVERVCHYFARYGIQADANVMARDLWADHMGEVL